MAANYHRSKNQFLKALVEITFIIFLFYSNLLMGDFTHAGNAHNKSLAWAVKDVFTTTNFEIALAAAFIGYLLFEFLRKRFR